MNRAITTKSGLDCSGVLHIFHVDLEKKSMHHKCLQISNRRH